jgi:hypothetical protein
MEKPSFRKLSVIKNSQQTLDKSAEAEKSHINKIKEQYYQYAEQYRQDKRK